MNKLLRPLRALLAATVGVALIALIAGLVSLVAGWTAAAILAALIVVLLAAIWIARRHVRRGTTLEVDLDTAVVERTPPDPVGRALAQGRPTLRDLVDAIDRAATDTRIAGLVARVGNGHLGVAQIQELRDAVKRFSQAGKKTIAFSETFGEGSNGTFGYYLAAAFDEIWLQPTGDAYTLGVISRVPFLRPLFDRLGISPDLDHRKEYKAAKYRLTEDHFVEPHREATARILESHLAQFVADVASDRRLPEATVRELVDRSPLTADETLSAGLVDKLGYRDEAYPKRRLFLGTYLKRAGRPHRKGTPIALIYGTGEIARGKSRFSPLGGTSSMGVDDVAAAFRTAVKNKKIKGVLFRVDSPGGSAVASDVVAREVANTVAAGKPVVVSMGDIAGSGGYWVSMYASKIVAQPGTLTGSIGVVSGKLVTRDAWRRQGIAFDELHVGDRATFTTGDYPYDDDQRQVLEASLDHIYDTFVAKVAEGRGLDPAEVEPVAHGRVWTGEDARRHRLVDELGGMDVALAELRRLLDLAKDAPVRLIELPKQRKFSLGSKKESSEAVAAMARDALAMAAPLAAIRSLRGGPVRMPEL